MIKLQENNGQISVSLESVLASVKAQRNDALDNIASLNAYIDELRGEIVELREQVAKFEAERDTQGRS